MLRGEVNPCGVAVAKASPNRAFLVAAWRPEPTRVENLGDELWVGVKGQSNSVIAGSPRNAFRCSVAWWMPEVEHWMG